jgi:hypothetical protein
MSRRRISIRVEHTEVTISIAETSAPANGSLEAQGIMVPPNLCPDCGAAWIPNFQKTVSGLHLDAARLQTAATEGRLHLFCAPDDEIWICESSIQQMKEKS